MLTIDQFTTLLYDTDKSVLALTSNIAKGITCHIYNGLEQELIQLIMKHLDGSETLYVYEPILLADYTDPHWHMKILLGVEDEATGECTSTEQICIYHASDCTEEIDYDSGSFSTLTIDFSLIDLYNDALERGNSWVECMCIYRENIAYSCYEAMCSIIDGEDYLIDF